MYHSADVADAADRNLVTHFTWVQRRLSGMHVKDDGMLVLADSGLACDTFNAVCRARLDRSTAAEHVREAIAWFANVKRPFSWWVGPVDKPDDLGDLLRAEGLEHAETELAMAADLTQMEMVNPAVEGLEIRRVRTEAELAQFAAINAANWNPPDQMVTRFYAIASGVLLSVDSPLRFYVGYLEGVAVAASELTLGGGVAGLYSISTLEGYRRRGIGSALTRWPLIEAARDGISTAILQASADGVEHLSQDRFQALRRDKRIQASLRYVVPGSAECESMESPCDEDSHASRLVAGRRPALPGREACESWRVLVMKTRTLRGSWPVWRPALPGRRSQAVQRTLMALPGGETFLVCDSWCVGWKEMKLHCPAAAIALIDRSSVREKAVKQQTAAGIERDGDTISLQLHHMTVRDLKISPLLVSKRTLAMPTRQDAHAPVLWCCLIKCNPYSDDSHA